MSGLETERLVSTSKVVFRFALLGLFRGDKGSVLRGAELGKIVLFFEGGGWCYDVSGTANSPAAPCIDSRERRWGSSRLPTALNST